MTCIVCPSSKDADISLGIYNDWAKQWHHNREGNIRKVTHQGCVLAWTGNHYSVEGKNQHMITSYNYLRVRMMTLQRKNIQEKNIYEHRQCPACSSCQPSFINSGWTLSWRFLTHNKCMSSVWYMLLVCGMEWEGAEVIFQKRTVSTIPPSHLAKNDSRLFVLPSVYFTEA